MKRLLQISILLLFASCGSLINTTNSIADEKFKLCSDIKYNKLVTEFEPVQGKLMYKKNIHALFENLLLRENYLKEISKSGYVDLLNKVEQKKIKPELLDKFLDELEFDPYSLFPASSYLSCYEYLFEQLKILDKNDITSWQYKFVNTYNKFETSGDLGVNNNYIINALNQIPEKEFNKIMYRKLFLDLIFRQLN